MSYPRLGPCADCRIEILKSAPVQCCDTCRERRTAISTAKRNKRRRAEKQARKNAPQASQSITTYSAFLYTRLN
jgi:hypothetical protein